MALGILGIIISAYSFPYKLECASHLLWPFVGAPFVYFSLGLFIFSLCQLLEKLIKCVNRGIEEGDSKFSVKDKKAIKNLGFFRFIGLFVLIIGMGGIILGIHGLIFDCEQVRYINTVLTWSSISFIPLGWLIIHISRQLKVFYASNAKAIEALFEQLNI